MMARSRTTGLHNRPNICVHPVFYRAVRKTLADIREESIYAVARVVELVREDSLQATGRYTDVKNAIESEIWNLKSGMQILDFSF